MGKKSKAERRKAAGKHEQRRGAQVTNADKAIISDVRLAADFLTNGSCCPKAVKEKTGIQKGQLAQIANGAIQPKSYQQTIIKEAATTLGWKAPSA